MRGWLRRLFKHGVDRLLRAPIEGALAPIRRAAAEREVREILSDQRARTPDNPTQWGFKVYSQFDEDGIIEAIFDRVGDGQTFIEIGCGRGVENNTHYLLLKGWRGVWVDGSQQNVAHIHDAVGRAPSRRLLTQCHFVDRDNISGLLAQWLEFLGVEAPDFFSLDIDGNDLHVLARVVAVCKPRVLCLEYNAKFPPPISVSVSYDQARRWEGDDYMGASLQALVEHLNESYRLVCCNLTGANAFFCRSDVARAFTEYPISDLYQPARYHLLPYSAGHTPSLKWLRDVLARDRG